MNEWTTCMGNFPRVHEWMSEGSWMSRMGVLKGEIHDSELARTYTTRPLYEIEGWNVLSWHRNT